MDIFVPIVGIVLVVQGMTNSAKIRKETMNGQHWLTLGIGVLIGWLVLPLVLGMFAGKQ